ncbi:fatty acid desaturase family protein [Rhizobium straminoryzae]|uniref:Fatty acid desaturase n=1 Tax=Rhizobium straminoryzae TaxID=1387186 RepID=A0A549TDV9_9HYPH|nr:fatty acid desaturase [Rhizobium straminoryzae]TRL40261.1 fatty acid desaturase [Rhizobium straminoryzae]
MKLFAYSRWDAVSVLAALAHLAFNIYLIVGFESRPLWLSAALGAIYAISISWNINSISHNFIHTPYFRPRWMNYAFSLLESVAIGFSQTYYHWVHMRHHSGNSDRPDDKGHTIDPLSIYKHGKNGEPENVFSYTFLSFFRDDIGDIHRAIAKRRPFDANWGRFELATFVAVVGLALLYDWKAVLFFVPFYYLGNCLSSLNGYYEHLNGDPDEPIAWGVSSYRRFYNWLWFQNGYHAEHHYRPKTHWTDLPALHQRIAEEQAAAGTHVISTCHALGFLAPENHKDGKPHEA